MKHSDCANFLSLDCEKGMCALSKMIVPLDGEGSDACPKFKQGFHCAKLQRLDRADRLPHHVGGFF